MRERHTVRVTVELTEAQMKEIKEITKMKNTIAGQEKSVLHYNTEDEVIGSILTGYFLAGPYLDDAIKREKEYLQKKNACN